MPGVFLFALIFFAIGCAAFVVRKFVHPDYKDSKSDKRALAAIGTGLIALAMILTLVSSWNPVGTQQLGIETSFGQTTGHLSPGLNLTAPWVQVTDMDEAYQITDVTFTVRIAGGQTAQATEQLRWQVNPPASDAVFQSFKNSTSGVQEGLITPELNAATNAVLDGYDPLTPLAQGIPAGTPGNPSTTQLSDQIQKSLIPRLDGDVQIRTLVLKPLVYDKTVQDRINAVLAQTAQTDVAQQAIKTAQAQAQANQIAEQSLASNPLVLVQQCFNGLAEGKFTLPAGSSCWPGAGSGIVIPAASK